MMAVRPVACKAMSYQGGGSTFGRSERRRQRGATLGSLLVAFLMAGCTSGGPGASGPAGSPSEAPVDAPSQSLELASPKPPSEGVVTYTGVLGADPIEGGCTYLQTADGQRFEIIPPEGWQLNKGAAEFMAPDGTVVARAGDTVMITGHEADMMSICQIGPIIQATEVAVGG
jgi:hypothetical protein